MSHHGWQCRPANRRLKNIVLVLFNKCQNENPITKSRTQVLQSQSDVHQTTDKDVPLTLIFFVCALDSDKFVCLASKQGPNRGFPEWDRQQTISRFGWICVLQRVAASAADISTAEESYWKKLVEHQKEHVRMDSRGYKGTYIRRKYDHSTNLQNQIAIPLDMSVPIIKYLDWSKSNMQVD